MVTRALRFHCLLLLNERCLEDIDLMGGNGGGMGGGRE